MSEEKKKISADEVYNELSEQVDYAVKLLKDSREALVESHIGKDFKFKPPRAVIMHAISRALTEVDLPVDYPKLHRGLISLCLFFLEDDDVSLALKIKHELRETDEK